MKITVCMFGMPKNVLFREQIEYYATLISKKLPVQTKLLKEAKGDENTRAEQELRVLEKELQCDAGYKVVLDAKGRQYSTEDFAVFIEKMMNNGRDVSFYIGNFYGIDDRIRSNADTMLSLSAMTFTHECAAMLLYEQLYRVHTVLFGGKYHK